MTTEKPKKTRVTIDKVGRLVEIGLIMEIRLLIETWRIGPLFKMDLLFSMPIAITVGIPAATSTSTAGIGNVEESE